MSRSFLPAVVLLALMTTPALADVGDSSTAAGDIRDRTTIDGRGVMRPDTPPSPAAPHSIEENKTMIGKTSNDATDTSNAHTRALPCAQDPAQGGCSSLLMTQPGKPGQ